ncbi:alkylphosphonate utilization protein [Thioclava sp. SK-1]|uniref:alpha-D-ribose 1-methylphosphonate 5-triphosphate diphosphatase n=1 Tax=Thioclava sp. SK-1 TaxID=1889770 RepID=UPI000825DB2B|nr:alpha-D-ribose 1-methylphosphonate 5-triphosphate diphosphatase [Thioclava sp. SK-1]OCX66282.1 alkylphosphonate utilization protein [Thioclava sp. SK-1]
MTQIAPLCLTGARVLTPQSFDTTSITVAQGRISTQTAPEVDLSGYLLLPGIVDLHGDGFERHLNPRPSAPFEKRRALASAAAELAANGVTTAWFAQSWSWEGGFRSGGATEALLEALSAVRQTLLPDVRLQVRLETHVVPEHGAVGAAIARHGVDYVVFNNHLPEAVELYDSAPDRFASWAAQHRLTTPEMLKIVRDAQAQEPDVAQALRAIAAEFATAGVKMGSHDDDCAATRARFRALQAQICEFPTSVAAAQAAHDHGEPVLMGAPNVVRRGSQSGNIAAEDLIKHGLCDALVSDYYYPALAQAAFALVDRTICDLPHAWSMISTAPARIMGLHDRGTIVPGQRADLVAVNPDTRMIEMTLCAGKIAHMSGALAARMMLPAAVYA